MNDYLIKYKIATVAELIKSFELEGYEFTSYTKEWWECDAWVATKIIKANTAGEARFEFMKGLMPQIEKCSVVSQCAFRFVANSYFIYKQTNNPEKIVFIYFVRSVGHTGLHFDEEEITQLPKLASVPNQKAFLYIAEASNATTFYTRLIMLIGAVEAFAGEITKDKKIITNQDEIKKILGKDLYKKLYEYGKGLRHKLLHGNLGAHHLFDGLTDEIYNKIRIYLRENFDVQISENVVQPQRNFYGNFEAASMFMKFNDEPILDLKEIEEAIDDKKPNSHEKEQKIFTYYGGNPENY